MFGRNTTAVLWTNRKETGILHHMPSQNGRKSALKPLDRTCWAMLEERGRSPTHFVDHTDPNHFKLAASRDDKVNCRSDPWALSTINCIRWPRRTTTTG